LLIAKAAAVCFLHFAVCRLVSAPHKTHFRSAYPVCNRFQNVQQGRDGSNNSCNKNNNYTNNQQISQRLWQDKVFSNSENFTSDTSTRLKSELWSEKKYPNQSEKDVSK